MEEKKKTVNIGEALGNWVSEQPYGQVIRYQDIEAVTKERRKTQRYYNAIAAAKKIALENGKMIKSIGGGDYKVLYPGDYSGAYVREVRLARTRIKNGDKILSSAPVNDMTAEERSVHNDVSGFHARLQAMIHGNYVEVKRLVGKRQHPLSIGTEGVR